MTQFADDAAVGGDSVEDTTVATEAVVENHDVTESTPGEVTETEMYPDDKPADSSEEDDTGEQQTNEDDEPAEVIEAPASLNADEKTQFAQLDPKAQRLLADVEARRNSQVTAATTKAANAQREAESRAAMADAQAKAVYSQQLRAVVESIKLPDAPDPRLAATDPASYVAQKAHYDAAQAELSQFMQEVESIGGEANATVDQAFVDARDRALMAIPEIQNEETRTAFFDKAFEAADKIGLDRSQIDHATADELKALRTIYDDQQDAKLWREHKAAKDAARRNPNGQFKPTRQLPPVTIKPGTITGRPAQSNDPIKVLYPND
jgi:hypothetical protein